MDTETRINEDGVLIPICCVFTIDNIVYEIQQNEVQNEGLDIIQKFFEICKKKVHNYQIFYIHNLDFDGFFILHYLIQAKLNYEWFFNKNKFYYIKVYIDNIIIEFRCSYKLLPYSLNHLGEKFLNKKKPIFPYKLLYTDDSLLNKVVDLTYKDFNTLKDYQEFSKLYSLNNFNILENLVVYCKQDILILLELITAYWKVLSSLHILDTGFVYSASSIALQYYITNYNKINLKPKIVFEIYARNAYYGGRCEVFGNLKSHEVGLYYDYPGMYALCLQESLPANNYYFCKPDNFDLPGFYKITFSSKLEYPVLPIKTDKLYFPNGTYTATYWYEEILLFLECGGKVIEIHSALIAKDYTPVAKDFSENLIKLKKKNNWLNLGAKLIINSFYGRLGIENKTSIAKITTNLEDIGYANNYVQFGDYYIYEKQYIVNTKRNVLVAAAITAKARIRLYRTIQHIINNGGRPLYCDTDSVLWAVNSNNLNIWKSEFTINNFNVIVDNNYLTNPIVKTALIAPKTYAILQKNNEETICIKGISNHTLNFFDFYNAWKNNKILNFVDQINYSTINYQGSWKKINKEIVLKISNKRIFNNTCEDSQPHDQLDGTHL